MECHYYTHSKAEEEEKFNEYFSYEWKTSHSKHLITTAWYHSIPTVGRTVEFRPDRSGQDRKKKGG